MGGRTGDAAFVVPFVWGDPDPLIDREVCPLSDDPVKDFLGVEPFALPVNPLETGSTELSSGLIFESSKRLRLFGGLPLPPSIGPLACPEARVVAAVVAAL